MKEKIQVENLIMHDDFLAIHRRCHYNEFIADYYDKFAEDDKIPVRLSDTGEIVYAADPEFRRKANNIRGCSKAWQFDFYKKNGFKNLVRVNRCKDRFCLNCMALEADQRFFQYEPVLDAYTEDYDLYHIVFTCPNVDADRLKDTVALMMDRFGYLIRYFKGDKKIRNVDFLKYGYQGAVRSLEITVSKRNGSFHPHLHTIFILEKGLDMSQVFWNQFSEDKYGRIPTRLYSEFEVLLQRLWALLLLKIPATKANIENIAAICDYSDGFSVHADLSNHKYHEVFKYAIKGSFKEETLFKFDTFKTLYTALFGRRVYQSYGCLAKYDFNAFDENLGFDSYDAVFAEFISNLQNSEVPKRIEEVLNDILKMSKEGTYKYVSKATFVRHFKALTQEDKEIYLSKLLGDLKSDVTQLEIKGPTSDQNK